jgi:type IV secretion system protein VirD4
VGFVASIESFELAILVFALGVFPMFTRFTSRRSAIFGGQPLQEFWLGWETGRTPEFPDFRIRPAAAQGVLKAVTYQGDGNLITCAPTGAGKGRGVLIPNVLMHPGPLICIDIKGEIYQVCARRRRELGQQVIALDPFGLVTKQSDCLNPLDLLCLPRSDMDSDSEMLASLLAVGNECSREPFWSNTANGLMSGLVAHIASGAPQERHFGLLREWLYHADMDYAIALALDKNHVKSRMARDQFVAYLAAPPEQTRPCIRATACSYINALGSEQVLETLRSSTFSLQDLYDGKPLSIFIIIPPDKLESHKALIRLWVGTLLTVVTRRTVMPTQRTLFLLDEVAQLGPLPILRQAITLLRGSGLQTWTVWQDLSQLRQLYPNDWQTIVNNSGVLQVFGLTNNNMAKEWADLLGQGPERLLHLPREDAMVHRQGDGITSCRRLDYLSDQAFAGLFDDNPRFALQTRK